MTDFYPILRRHVDGLTVSTGEARRKLYERARTALVDQLRGRQPPMPEADIARERLALEEAVRKVELEAARRMRDAVVVREAEAREAEARGAEAREAEAREAEAPEAEAREAAVARGEAGDFRNDPLPIFKLVDAEQVQAVETWRNLNTRLDQEQHGARIELSDDGLFSFSGMGTESDREVAEAPLTQELQSEIQRKARALQSCTIRLSNQPGWSALATAVDLMTEAISRPPDEIAANIGTIWSLSVSLGGYIEQDDDARANPNGLINPLEADVLRTLRDLVTTAAPWVRRIPYGADAR